MKILVAFKGLLSQEVFPSDWFVLRIVSNKYVLHRFDTLFVKFFVVLQSAVFIIVLHQNNIMIDQLLLSLVSASVSLSSFIVIIIIIIVIITSIIIVIIITIIIIVITSIIIISIIILIISIIIIITSVFCLVLVSRYDCSLQCCLSTWFPSSKMLVEFFTLNAHSFHEASYACSCLPCSFLHHAHHIGRCHIYAQSCPPCNTPS